MGSKDSQKNNTAKLGQFQSSLTSQTETTTLLILIQSFETLWAYYSQSNGQLYDTDCRHSATMFVEALLELEANDPSFKAKIDDLNINRCEARKILERVYLWGNSSWLAPFESLNISREKLFGLLSALKIELHIRLSISFTPNIQMSAKEVEHSDKVRRWIGYLPDAILNNDKHAPDEIVKEASGVPSIVAVGDIRNSQKIMNVLGDSKKFIIVMRDFIRGAKKIINDNYGFFDKFTGDGFIVYFNKNICAKLDVDYVEAFLTFAKEIQQFGIECFGPLRHKMEKKFKLGLLIGADFGIVDFHDEDNHLIAVGNSVVWAHRMSSIDKIDEIIAHSNLVDKLAGIRGVRVDRNRGGITKNGISYSARSIDIRNSFHAQSMKAIQIKALEDESTILDITNPDASFST